MLREEQAIDAHNSTDSHFGKVASHVISLCHIFKVTKEQRQHIQKMETETVFGRKWYKRPLLSSRKQTHTHTCWQTRSEVCSLVTSVMHMSISLVLILDYNYMSGECYIKDSEEMFFLLESL